MPASLGSGAVLTLFTVPKPFRGHVGDIQRNAIESWSALGPLVQIVLIGDDDGVEEAARDGGVEHVGKLARNDRGTPRLDSAFERVETIARHPLWCLVNGDIILLDDFLAAARQLPREAHLSIGQRWNWDVRSPIDFASDGDGLADSARRDGTLDLGRGSDYFLYPRSTDFGMPPFAVGRPGWDNWIIGRTLELGLPLIDITESVTVIHQNHDYGHVAVRSGLDWEGPEAQRNRKLGGWLDRYLHTPSNATHLLTPGGLRRARSPRHGRAKLEAFVALHASAAPLRWLLRLVRRARSPRGDASCATDRCPPV
jgi:hypothetical protein